MKRVNDNLFESIIAEVGENETGERVYLEGSYGRAVEDVYVEWMELRSAIIDEFEKSYIGRFSWRLINWLNKRVT